MVWPDPFTTVSAWCREKAAKMSSDMHPPMAKAHSLRVTAAAAAELGRHAAVAGTPG